MQSPFHAYATARMLEQSTDSTSFAPVFASSNIQIYPFQIAAARFALRSPYQKGVILCDESGMGKSHEAMLVVAQRWHEGENRILIVIPNADLLVQWVALMDTYYTLPFSIANSDTEQDNPFRQEGVILSTYDFVAEHEALASGVSWDLTVFDEATALSGVYKDDNKQGKALKRIADPSFKLLLTGTPIEKNIMDLYGLMYFIDERVLPPEQEFLGRYLRRPEHYPELSQQVSRYCFRTLRSQARQYAKLPNRIPITHTYTPSPEEQELYTRLSDYCNRDNKFAFPQMDNYDLSLRLLGLLGSSTAAILGTLQGIITRLQSIPEATAELAELQEIEALAQSVTIDAKTVALLDALPNIFKRLKKVGAAQKALIFTESIATQKYLFSVLSTKFSTVIYNGSTDYTAIEAFLGDTQILISSDHGARGFHLADCSFVVQYDLLYNTLKMEQRIDRAHRLGQNNDVLVLSFINQHNFADVRKLELVNKRMLVADGVFGLSDEVVGGFTDQLSKSISALNLRTKTEIDHVYHQTLSQFESENRQLVSAAEDVLFTTFTPKLAGKLNISPNYISQQAEELNNQLWDLVVWFFTQYNATHDDCHYVIDEEQRTITAENYTSLPELFYYWNGSRNTIYRSQKVYGMGADFKPKAGRITLTSILGRGIIREITCPDKGTLTPTQSVPHCTLALYVLRMQSNRTTVGERPVWVGRRHTGEPLESADCQTIFNLSVDSYTQEGRENPSWLRTSSTPSPLDTLVPVEQILEEQRATLTDVQQEEVERLRLSASKQKSDLQHELEDLQLIVKQLEQELSGVSHDRMKTIVLQRKINEQKKTLLQKQDRQFFHQMELDVALDKEIAEFLGQEKLNAKAVKQFEVEVTNDDISK
ncbi:MAG: SNF2-related protein [Rikenellaceae bacterium]